MTSLRNALERLMNIAEHVASEIDFQPVDTGGDPLAWQHGIDLGDAIKNAREVLRASLQEPVITAQFETVSNGLTGSTDAPIKRIEHQDDGTYTVVIDHWPSSQGPEAGPEHAGDKAPSSGSLPNTSGPVSPATTPAPGTDDARTLERRCATLSTELAAYKQTAPLCDEHRPQGGVRANCLVCGLIELSHALSEIDYLCDEPNDMHVSSYDVHCDPNVVIAHVQKLKDDLAAARQTERKLRRLIERSRKTSFSERLLAAQLDEQRKSNIMLLERAEATEKDLAAARQELMAMFDAAGERNISND